MSFVVKRPLVFVLIAAGVGVGVTPLLLGGPKKAEAAPEEKREPPKPIDLGNAPPSPRAAKEDDNAVRKAGQAYVEAMNAGDLAAVAAFWSKDAEYTDAAGKTYRGREVVAGLLKEALAGMKGCTMRGKVHSLRFLRPDVVMEDGELECRSADGSHASNRYSVIWLKNDGRWLIGSARDLPTSETSSAPSAAYPKLQHFEWLVGEWQGGAKGEAKLHCRWASNKCFLLMEYTVERPDGGPLEVSQRVGWDPAAGAIRSWVFDSVGGFGEGAWKREGNRWVIEAVGVLPDGGSGNAINTYEFVDANTFVWRSRERTVDGQPLADVEMKFVKKTTAKQPQGVLP